MMDNPILASSPGNAETSLCKDLHELRDKGNKCFRDEDWNMAIPFYSKCIDLALSRHKYEPQRVPSSSDIQEKVKEALLYSYSNRAEARIKLKEYGAAVQDCDKALALDDKHLKSLFRKGRAFHYLREYKLACLCFGRALQQSPTAKDIQMHYEKSMELSRQNQQGKFDLSACFSNVCSNAPEFSNYIGPVLIKRSVGLGRGLFTTDEVDIGDFLVVDNAIASSCTEITRLRGSHERVMKSMIEARKKHSHVKRELGAKVLSCAASSPRIMQQLKYLADSDEIRAPPMDLFRINNASWNNYDIRNHWDLDQHKLAKIMLNAGCDIEPIEINREINRQREKYGLWVLPSFIKHSCYPNANCIVVGEAMFIIAARKIAAGEEITIPYIDTLYPLIRREAGFMGCKCGCKRCVLERSLGSPLREISELVESMDATMLSDLELWEIAMRVENIIDALTTEEKHMIRASFFHLYYNIFGLKRIHPNARTTLPSYREVFYAIQEVIPGNYMCLEGFAKYSGYAQIDAETDKVLLQKVMEVCRGYMGNHEEGRLKAVLNSAATDVFKPGLVVFLFRNMNSCVGE